MSDPNYYIAETGVFEHVPAHQAWTAVKAKTIDGAQRLATKMARGVTYTVRVARRGADGEYLTVCQLDNSLAITRRRPKWRYFI